MTSAHATPVDKAGPGIGREPPACAPSPTRGGTLDWDDRRLMEEIADAASSPLALAGSGPLAAGGGALAPRGGATDDEAPRASSLGVVRTASSSPTRGGTRDWDELLPPGLRLRYAARDGRDARGPIRGGTLSWDELLAAVLPELDGGAPGPPSSVSVEVQHMVFEPGERSDDQPDMLRWLAPDADPKV